MLHICISENRRQDEVGVKLLVLSLTRHQPDAILHLFVDDLGEGIRDWLLQFANVRLEHLPIDRALGWNIKAKLLATLFANGLDEIVWIDSDIIITAPIGRFFCEQPQNRLITAEEFFTFRNRGVLSRAQGWNLDVGRELSFTPNSCIVRATRFHSPLLAEWQLLLDRQDYRETQERHWTERPFYMMGDQDALSALLGSRAFENLDVQSIRNGRDIAQCFGPDGYSPIDRLRNLGRLPPFVHAQGGKPWRLSAQSQMYHYVSPYWYAAHAYLKDLLPEERAWLEQRPGSARLLDCLTFGDPNLAGLPSAMTFLIRKRLKSLGRLLARRG